MEQLTSMNETNESEITIERATPQDAEVICDIRDRARIAAYPNEALGITADDVALMAQGPGGEFLARRIAHLKEQFADRERLDTLVARQGDDVVGFVTPEVDEHGVQSIDALYVKPEMQHKGIGAKLMEQALYELDPKHDIYLDVVSYNQKAIDFYARYGFEATDAVVPPEPGRPEYLKSLPMTEMVLRAKRR